MTRTVYLNGDYLPETEAKVSIFDRGFLMSDGVYEVTSVLGGKLIDFAGHCARLGRSLSELGMAAPCSDAELLAIHRELIARNAVTDAMSAQLRDAVARAEADPGVHAVVLTGAGKAFCAGADLGSGGATFDYEKRLAARDGGAGVRGQTDAAHDHGVDRHAGRCRAGCIRHGCSTSCVRAVTAHGLPLRVRARGP